MNKIECEYVHMCVHAYIELKFYIESKKYIFVPHECIK